MTVHKTEEVLEEIVNLEQGIKNGKMKIISV